MLRKITIDNYTTFIKKTSIDFKATNSKILEETNLGNNRILKGALFVGENASGKTQILKAITFLLDCLFSNKKIDFILNKSLYTDKTKYNIEYTFDIDNSEIRYFIEIDLNKIISEKLFMNDNLLLDRLGSSGKVYFKTEKFLEALPDDLLLLRRVYFDTKFYSDKTLNKWFEFLQNSIYINCYSIEVKDYGSKKRFLQNYLTENSVDEINNFLSIIGDNHQIKLEKDGIYKSKIFTLNSEDSNPMISFVKKGTKIYIPDLLESTGNITLTQIIPSLIYVTKNDGMIILDEFSSGLHNELEEALIKYFYEFTNNSQLFFTSHSTNILSTAIIRPDQIYSTSFKAGVGTVLKRFSEEMPRESQNIEKMYLGGVFDGLSRYNKFFKNQ